MFGASKQKFDMLRFFELATQAGLEIVLVSFFRVINVDFITEELFL